MNTVLSVLMLVGACSPAPVAAPVETSEPLLPLTPWTAFDDQQPPAAAHVGEILLRGSTLDGVLTADALRDARACFDAVLARRPGVTPKPLGAPTVTLWLTDEAEARLRATHDLSARAGLAELGRVGRVEVDNALEALGALRVRQFTLAGGEIDGALVVDLPWSVDPIGAAWRLGRGDIERAEPGGGGGLGDADHVLLRVDDAGWHLISYQGSGDCFAGCIDKKYETFTCDPRTSALVEEGPDGEPGRVPRYGVPLRASLQPYADLDAVLAAARSPDRWVSLHALEVLQAVMQPDGPPPVSEDFPIRDRWVETRAEAGRRAPEIAQLWVATMRRPEPYLAPEAWEHVVRWRGQRLGPDDESWAAWAEAPPAWPD